MAMPWIVSDELWARIEPLLPVRGAALMARDVLAGQKPLKAMYSAFAEAIVYLRLPENPGAFGGKFICVPEGRYSDHPCRS